MDTNKSVVIGGHHIGQAYRPFLVAEAGTTANGNIEQSLALVDAAVKAGMDAIKFMIINPDEFMSDKKVEYKYEWGGGKGQENMYEMFKKLMFTPEQWRTIRDHCRKQGILFYATIDYLDGVDLAESLEVVAYKLSSWDVINYPLIRKMARTGKPLQIDLGPATLAEIVRLVDVCKEEGNEQLILVHCTHANKEEQVHMKTLPYLRNTFHLPVGYSADTREIEPDLLSIGLGVDLIEKRITLDKNFPGHHHIKALEPQELAVWASRMRYAHALLGREAVTPSDEDLRQKPLYYVSLTAKADIPSGTLITENMVACKRPGTGISPDLMHLLVGRKAAVDIQENTQFTWEMIA